MTKTYVVTGSTSGIGRSVIENLPKDNIIFAAYRSEEHFEELKNISNNIKPFYVDYAKPETIKPAVEFILSDCDKIDTLINIAGCVVAGPVEKISIDEIKRQFNVNVFGHLELTQGLINIMDGGKIINVSSMASYGIFPFISPYCASKKCLDMFFNSFLIENKHNIQVVSIRPGVISTPLWEKSIQENVQRLKNCEGYEQEMEYIRKNAEKNSTTGINVKNVVDVILKADSLEKPKLVYTVGKDALFARIVSKLPQSMINKLIKVGIKSRINAIQNS